MKIYIIAIVYDELGSICAFDEKKLRAWKMSVVLEILRVTRTDKRRRNVPSVPAHILPISTYSRKVPALPAPSSQRKYRFHYSRIHK